jgi:hypothetical protein
MNSKTKLLLSAAVIAAFGSLAVAGSTLADDGARGARHAGPGPQMADFGHHGHGGDCDGPRHGPRFGKGPGGAAAMLKEFDANGDGKLTQEEIDTARANRVAEFDADKDGSLSLDEYQALWMSAMRERMVDRFQFYDNDGNGIITVEEYSEPFAQTVERWDRNDDGALSKDDRPQKHHEKKGDDGDND